MVLFDYHQSRGKSVPEEVLKDFNGCLQTDGYAGYDQLGKRADITHIGCMAHARRKFEAALDNDFERANHALVEMQKLYAIERYFKKEQPEVDRIKELRQQDAIPVLKGLKQWMEKEYASSQVSPISRIG